MLPGPGAGVIADGDCSPPLEVRLDAPKRVLEIVWADRTSTALPARLLRQRCLCGACRREAQLGRTIAAAPDVTLCTVVAYGPGALNLGFSDGHGRGIFPFTYLRTLAAAAAAILATSV